METAKEFPFYWIDVFTHERLGGNPCVVILGADELTDAQMQTIAKEMNLSETAFVMSSKRADFSARYFTPVEELPFAGHPTIATVHALIDAKAFHAGRDRKALSLELKAGIVPVEASLTASGSKVLMSQLRPDFLRVYDPAEVLPLYGLSEKDLLSGASIQTVSTGSPILMIPLSNQDALRRCFNADPEGILRLRKNGDFLFAHHFCLSGATPEGQTFARSFPTPPNTLEDPFTGSATGCMAAYLWKYHHIDTPKFIAEQGHWMGRPGRAEVEVVGPRDSIQTVRVAGEAITLVSGMMRI